MRDFLTEVRKKILVYDGAKGVMLQRKGLPGNEAAESWNLTRPGDVREVYLFSCIPKIIVVKLDSIKHDRTWTGGFLDGNRNGYG
jgi:hypothetical protein